MNTNFEKISTCFGGKCMKKILVFIPAENCNGRRVFPRAADVSIGHEWKANALQSAHSASLQVLGKAPGSGMDPYRQHFTKYRYASFWPQCVGVANAPFFRDLAVMGISALSRREPGSFTPFGAGPQRLLFKCSGVGR